MTNLQKVALRQSEIRTRLHELGGVEDVTDEIRSEIGTLTTEMKDLETRSQALIAAGEQPEEEPAGEQRDEQLQDLIERADMGSIFMATLEHRSTDGATRELQDEYSLGANQIPLGMLETRAVTPAPADVGQNQAEIIPGVFPMSCAAFLGVDMPTVGIGDAVFPVLTKNATVHLPAENATAAETDGSFSADVLSPGRLQASFFYSREDRARFAGMDAALRENLSMALSDRLDQRIIGGNGGLLNATNLPNHNVSAITTHPLYLTQFGFGRVDGEYAASATDLRVVVGTDTYAHMGGTYRSGNTADYSVLERLMEITGGVKVSAHVPDASSNKQNALIRLGMRRDMVAPIWEGVTLIPDEVTKAGSGEIVITAVMLHAIKILRADGFYKQQTQHA